MRRPRVPRQRLVAATGGATTSFKSQYLDQTAGTGSTAQAWGHVWVNPAVHAPADDPGSSVARQYQEYVVHNPQLVYTPAVGTTTSGTIWIAYVDNPEILYKLASGVYAYSDYLKIAQVVEKHVAGPVWEALSLTASVSPRRKMFSVDSTAPASNEAADRVTQGAFIYATASAPLSTIIGFINHRYSATLRGLQSNLATSI